MDCFTNFCDFGIILLDASIELKDWIRIMPLSRLHILRTVRSTHGNCSRNGVGLLRGLPGNVGVYIYMAVTGFLLRGGYLKVVTYTP